MNNVDLPTGTFLGELRLKEVYGQYEGPYLLSCENGAGHLFLALVTERGPDSDEWLYAPISAQRLEFVRTGGVSLRTAFSASESGLAYLVRIPHEPSVAEIEQIRNENIPQDYYPAADVRLALPPASVEHRQPAYELARHINRDIVDLDLDFKGHVRSEAPALAVGRLLQEFQAFARSYGEMLLRRLLRAGQRLAPDILRKQTEFLVVPFAAGSFSVRLYAACERNMFQDAAAKRIVTEFLSLVESAADSAERLSEGLESISGASARHFERFLDSIAFDGAIALDWGQPDEERGYRTGISSVAAQDVLRSVRQRQLGEIRELDILCLAKGIHERLKNFEIEDVKTGERYHGKIADAAMETAAHATINATYRAVLRESCEGTPSTGLTRKYMLLAFETAGQVLL